MDDLFSDALRQLLDDQCTTAVVRQIEASGDGASLWAHLDSSGFADALVAEAQGGAGLSLREAQGVMALCGRYTVPVPLAETMMARSVLAQAVLSDAALSDAVLSHTAKGSITLAQGRLADDGSLVCANVQLGRVADAVLVSDAHHTWLLSTEHAQRSPTSFVLNADLRWSAEHVAAGVKLPKHQDVRLILSCINAAQLSGALLAVFNNTLQYANDRVQFGKAIGKFQAIQHQLSIMAEHSFAAHMAAQLGCASDTANPDRVRVAVAKARTSEAALEVASLSHSIHGAIGFTHEFDLQLFTRRLHAWRQSGGSESYWHTVLGDELVDHRSGLVLDLIRNATDVTA
jgi:acyl-CoA dehydrogenase